MCALNLNLQATRKEKMKKYLNKIIQGDCLEVMKDIPDKSVDLTVTSPPYDNLRDYEGYEFNFEGIARELYRVVKDGGVVVWIVADATINGSETGTSFKQALYFKEIGFNLHDTMIWQRRKAPLTHNRYEQAFEYMFIFSKGKPKTFNGIREKRKWKDNRKTKVIRREKGGKLDYGFIGRSKTVLKDNVWKINSGGGHATKDKVAFKHPAIFPERLAKMHVQSWSNEGDLVLDPMCGSGTTCKMAKLLGRNYVGIDISQKYVDVANQRLAQQVLL